MPTKNSFRTSFIVLVILLPSFCSTSFAQQLNDQNDLPSHENPSTNDINFRFQHYGEQEGLLQKKIFTIIQDQTGFLWLGTDQGLVRYDGYEFKTYSHQPDDSTSISNDVVRSLFVDSRGWLWVGTEDGLNCFNSIQQSFIQLQLIQEDGLNQKRNQVLSIQEDKKGAIWATNTYGISAILYSERDTGSMYPDREAITIQNFMPEPSEVDREKFQNRIQSLLIDSGNNIWVGAESGLMRLDSLSHNYNQGSSLQFVTEPTNVEDPTSSLSKQNILGLIEDGDKTIWAKTAEELIKIELVHGSNNSIHLKRFLYDDIQYQNGALVDISFDQKSRLWINLADIGFVVFDPINESFTKVTDEFSGLENASIPYFVHTIYKDRQDILWFGTDTGGLYRYDKLANSFSDFHPKLDALAYNKSIDMRFVFEDSHGDLWIANRGVYRCDRQTGEIKESFWTEELSDTLRWTFKNKITEDGLGNIWIASEFDGLYRYEHSTGKMRALGGFNFSSIDSLTIVKEDVIRTKDHYTNSLVSTVNDSLDVSDNVTALINDEDGNIWVASTVGLLKKDGKNSEIWVVSKIDVFSNTIKRYTLNFDDRLPDALGTNNYAYDISFDQSNNIWLGSSLGLIQLDTNTGATKIVQIESREQNRIKNTKIHSLANDQMPERYLWMGTNGNGLCLFDKLDEDILCYDTNDGLPGNTVSSILTDGNGNLWLATDKGLSNAFVNPESNEITKFRNYDRSDGIIDDDFSFFYGQSASQNSQGEMFFAGAKGISIFHSDDIKVNPMPPSVIISQFYLNFRKADYGLPNSPLTAAISEVDKLVLPYENNNFSLDLAALDLHAPEKVHFAYRLEGYQNDWIYLNNERRAVFTKVPPGSYVFHAKATNNDGLWNEEGVKLRITIIPPWYQTNWAYLLFGFSGFGFMYAGGRYELNRRRLKLQASVERSESVRLKEMDQIKTQFFTNISHEFRTPLALIKGPVQQELKDTSSRSTRRRMNMIMRNVNRLFHLINQLLDLSALEAHRVELRADQSDLVTFVHGITMGFASWAERKNISLKILSKEKQIDLYFDRDLMEKILNNLLSNAIKFTLDGGKVEVSIKQARQNKEVIIEVKDSGIGIATARTPHVFDRFYQADASTTREHEGSGIGLALVKELVELHHGKISLQSQEGIGTTFKLVFPLGKGHLNPDQVMASVIESKRVNKISVDEFDYLAENRNQAEESVTESTESRPLLLIVEDHADFRTYIKEILEDDFRILEAKNGQVGLEKASEKIPDLIISDVMMPIMDGYALCKKLKTDERTCHIPIILLTAKAAQEDKIEGLQTGADDYLSKPFDSRELKIRVQNLIEQRRNLQAFYQQRVIFKTGGTNIVSVDDQFLKKTVEIVEQQLENENFTVDELAKGVAMSRSQLHRKINALTGKSASQFIRAIRLQRAAELLRSGAGNVTEIAYMVGFSSQSYFTKCFIKQFKCSPSKYIQQN